MNEMNETDFIKPISANLKKMVASLRIKKKREENRLFTAEGEKLCRELIESSFKTELVVIRSSPIDDILALAGEFYKLNVPVYMARKKQFDGLCDTKTPQGILAVVNMEERGDTINEPFIALDGVSDPGNLGTIIRTADWFSIKHIILGENCADRFNPKVVRSTMGSMFRCRVSFKKDLASFVKEAATNGGFEIYGATLETDHQIEDFKPAGKFGLVFGSEAHGISDPVKNELTKEFKIPGRGKAESLNVAVSVGISLFHFSKYI